MRIVGVDCATKFERTGISIADFSEGILTVRECGTCVKGASPEKYLYPALRDDSSALIALDSPLGWSSALGRNLVEHKAGRPISDESNTLFRRLTDRTVREKLGKTPLEVGADRIARTARTALSFIGGLEKLIGREIPLAWDPEFKGGIQAIEVYPAGTLRAESLSNEHALDSVLCSVAGADFLQGLSIHPPPGQENSARKEGWIWIRDPVRELPRK